MVRNFLCAMTCGANWFALGSYCNFEFSCTGVSLAACGPSLSSRTPLSAATMQSIVRHATISERAFAERPSGGSWELLVEIPAAAFSAHAPLSASSLSDVRLNVYKCGDKVRSVGDHLKQAESLVACS